MAGLRVCVCVTHFVSVGVCECVHIHVCIGKFRKGGRLYGKQLHTLYLSMDVG